MPKEEEIRTLDSNTIDIYYNAYLTCRQIEKCASLRYGLGPTFGPIIIMQYLIGWQER